MPSLQYLKTGLGYPGLVSLVLSLAHVGLPLENLPYVNLNRLIEFEHSKFDTRIDKLIRRLSVNQYDEMTLIKWTVAQEAADQPYIGKLAVAYVIVNRMRKWKRSAASICWQPYQFSCWGGGNLDAKGKFLDHTPDEVIYDCGKAAVQAYQAQVADPTNGAVYYLNVDLVIRLSGKLPDWWASDTKPESEVKIGNHVFRQAKS